MCRVLCFFFQAEDGIRDAQESRGLGDVYKRQPIGTTTNLMVFTPGGYRFTDYVKVGAPLLLLALLVTLLLVPLIWPF